MKKTEDGYTLIELMIAIAIIAILSCMTAMTIFQTLKNIQRNKMHLTVVNQVQNAGFWIGNDLQMAESVVADNLEYPKFLFLSWTEQNFEGGDLIYHSITYYFTDFSNGVGYFKRKHWSSAGASEETMIAKYIYYQPGDPDNTSKVSYQNPVVSLKLCALRGDVNEVRDYNFNRRPTFNY